MTWAGTSSSVINELERLNQDARKISDRRIDLETQVRIDARTKLTKMFSHLNELEFEVIDLNKRDITLSAEVDLEHYFGKYAPYIPDVPEYNRRVGISLHGSFLHLVTSYNNLDDAIFTFGIKLSNEGRRGFRYIVENFIKLLKSGDLEL